MTDLAAQQASDLFRSAPSRHVDVDNGEVAVRSIGTGPDVLLVHGWPVSGATFRGLLPYLTPHVRCHVVDLVGAGESRFDRSVRFGIDEHAEAVRRVVDALDPEDLAVVGHDSGGLIARHALAEDPRVRGWGLLDTETPGRGGWRFRSFLALRHVPRIERVLATTFGAPRLRRSRWILGGCFADADRLDGEFDELFLRPLVLDADRRWAAGEMLRGFDPRALHALHDLHRRIHEPVRLVYGADDPFFPSAHARSMVPTFAGPATLHLVEGARLFAHEERPDVVASALLPVLTAAGPGTVSRRRDEGCDA